MCYHISMSTLKEKKPRTKLTLKQQRFVAEYLKDGNGSRSALKVYNAKNDLTARVIASENLTKPNVAKAIAEALPDDLLARKHLEGLEAVAYAPVLGEVPDYSTRHKYLDSAYKIKGTYAPEKQAIVHAFVLPDEEKARIDNILNDNAPDES